MQENVNDRLISVIVYMSVWLVMSTLLGREGGKFVFSYLPPLYVSFRVRRCGDLDLDLLPLNFRVV